MSEYEVEFLREAFKNKDGRWVSYSLLWYLEIVLTTLHSSIGYTQVSISTDSATSFNTGTCAVERMVSTRRDKRTSSICRCSWLLLQSILDELQTRRDLWIQIIYRIVEKKPALNPRRYGQKRAGNVMWKIQDGRVHCRSSNGWIWVIKKALEGGEGGLSTMGAVILEIRCIPQQLKFSQQL